MMAHKCKTIRVSVGQCNFSGNAMALPVLAAEKALNMERRRYRYFCPSCHQKRVLAYGEWVDETILAPVPHRQYVLTVPKMLRPIFRAPPPAAGRIVP
jgi:hypothetical protein